jgi:hypothetical protein
MSHVRLTLSCPQPLVEQVVEFLLDHETMIGGFTSLAAHGHGRDFVGATLRERVRGRVQSTLLMAILPCEDVTPLLQELRSQFRAPHLFYWTEPVLDFGDLS